MDHLLFHCDYTSELWTFVFNAKVRDLEAMKVSLLGVANLMDLEAYPLLVTLVKALRASTYSVVITK